MQIFKTGSRIINSFQQIHINLIVCFETMAENYDEIFKSTLHHMQSFSWETRASEKPTLSVV